MTQTTDPNKPQIMGILNITPDSFSDGGNFLHPDKAITQAKQMIQHGATIIDIGGESTRPGAASVSVDEELNRVIPIIKALKNASNVTISIDTSKSEVMREAVNAGASMINDVRALQGEGSLKVAAECDVPVCIMHMPGTPRTMQDQPEYTDVVNEVATFLQERIEICVNAGIKRGNIIIDPGFGFGKTVSHNLQLIDKLEVFKQCEAPILIGVSRKSTIGKVLDVDVDERLSGGLALTAIAVYKGAHIIRTHDVKATAQTLKMVLALKREIT